ncbi:psd [Lepeophtheirus salmonis]|uniref:Psd n=1 Tax=Lepeophtheirus salmonis TaxID=72036 RepID=A0A7R8HA50_LEPSM|nr:psd [Lepeophtheirus salmonis]CAF2959204.1 psd [Lepeophtheirus salmonis]
MGRIADAEIPIWAREPIFKTYSRFYNCNLDEVKSELQEFSSFSNFFRRELKEGTRPVCPESPLVSPCDGKVLHVAKVIYMGDWTYGFFSMTPVGATNVGSIRVGIDPELTTNQTAHKIGAVNKKDFEEIHSVVKGELFGEFNLGSTIVLLFEGPKKKKNKYLVKKDKLLPTHDFNFP